MWIFWISIKCGFITEENVTGFITASIVTYIIQIQYKCTHIAMRINMNQMCTLGHLDEYMVSHQARLMDRTGVSWPLRPITVIRSRYRQWWIIWKWSMPRQNGCQWLWWRTIISRRWRNMRMGISRCVGYSHIVGRMWRHRHLVSPYSVKSCNSSSEESCPYFFHKNN